MKRLFFTALVLAAMALSANAQKVEQVSTSEVRTLCAGEGTRAYHKVMAKFCYCKPGGKPAGKVKAWVDDRDGTLWAQNYTDRDDIFVYVRYVDKGGKEHKIYPRLPSGDIQLTNARIVGRNAAYVVEVGWGR